MLSWGNIDSCEWSSESRRVDFCGLRLRLRRVLKILPPVTILIPRDKREPVNALVARQLGDWPSDAPPSKR